LWDPGTGAERAVLTGHTNWVAAVAFSPDGQLLASASWDGTVRIWHVKTAKALSFLRLGAAIPALSWGPGAIALGEQASIVVLDVQAASHADQGRTHTSE
jgi:WD40 repeat protein